MTAVASLACERQRRHRARERTGKIQLSLEVDGKVIEVLIAVGAVSEAQALSKAALAEALEEMMAEWGARVLALKS